MSEQFILEFEAIGEILPLCTTHDKPYTKKKKPNKKCIGCSQKSDNLSETLCSCEHYYTCDASWRCPDIMQRDFDQAKHPSCIVTCREDGTWDVSSKTIPEQK